MNPSPVGPIVTVLAIVLLAPMFFTFAGNDDETELAADGPKGV